MSAEDEFMTVSGSNLFKELGLDKSQAELLNRGLEAIIRRGNLSVIKDVKNEWQPIETAPRDGTEVFAVARFDGSYCKNRYHGHYTKFENEKWVISGTRRQKFRPTHWMPIPAPPKKEEVK